MAEIDNSGLLQKAKDEKVVNDFLDGKSKTFDYNAFSRLIIHEMQVNNLFDENKILGFRRCDIIQMIQYPERNRKKILKLSDYMYLKSGYYKRLIDYFVNQVIINHTVETKINSIQAYKKADVIKSNFIKYAHQTD